MEGGRRHSFPTAMQRHSKRTLAVLLTPATQQGQVTFGMSASVTYL